MRVCVPVEEDRGLESPICAHFGSAPGFLIVDLDTRESRFVENTNSHHGHGMCQPVTMLAGEKLDAVVVGGIGLGAMRKLRAAGLEVFLADQQTVEQIVEAHGRGELERVTAQRACGQHGHGQHGRGQHGQQDGGCRGGRRGAMEQGARGQGRGARGGAGRNRQNRGPSGDRS